VKSNDIRESIWESDIVKSDSLAFCFAKKHQVQSKCRKLKKASRKNGLPLNSYKTIPSFANQVVSQKSQRSRETKTTDNFYRMA